MNKPWYEDRNYFISDILNEEHGVTYLMGRDIGNNKWEYAIVYWRYLVCTPLVIFVDGKTTFGEVTYRD